MSPIISDKSPGSEKEMLRHKTDIPSVGYVPGLRSNPESRLSADHRNKTELDLSLAEL